MSPLPGVVTESTGSWTQVLCSDGRVIPSRLAGRHRLKESEATHPIAVGDRVDVDLQEDGTGVIRTIHDRVNAILRRSTHKHNHAQVLVANLDMAWVVQSVRDPRYRTGFIDRFLATCEAFDVPAGILMNKTDLAKGKDVQWIEELRELYESLGYPFLACSAETGEGMEAVRERLEGRTSAVIGPSGAGKSSLLNRLDPSLDLQTGEISDYSGKGRHTTTFARLLRLSFGGMIADTPGIRELGLVDIEPQELSLYFPEMRAVSAGCRYPDCSHEHEPGCEVMEAFDRGEIDPERYRSYLAILESLRTGS